MLKKPSREELRLLLLSNTNESAAQFLKVGTRTVQRWRDQYGLNQQEVVLNGHTPTNLQNDIVIGTMLGDASIPWNKKGRQNKYVFAQKADRKNYVQFIYEQLKPYTINYLESTCLGPIRKNGIIVQNAGKPCTAHRVYTLCCEHFTNLRHQWYKNPYQKKSLKIIPNIKLNWTRFFFWFCDDGNNNVKKRTITLATNCFIESDVDKLISLAKQDLALNGSRRDWGTGPLIIFGTKDYDQIMNQLQKQAKQFNLEKTFMSKLNNDYEHDYKKYKSGKSVEDEKRICELRAANVSIEAISEEFGLSRSTIYRIVKKHREIENKEYPSGRKLTESQIIEIVNDWNKGVSQVKIADRFSVTQTMISQIVRRKTRCNITKNLWIRDYTSKDIATVDVVYNPN